MTIKAILLDIDGTLTNHEKKITPATKQALLTAQDYGIRLVIASGRPSRGIFPYGDQLNMREHHGLFVCYNGARVVDCTTGKVLVDITMPKELTHAVLDHVRKFDVKAIITHGSHMVVEDVYDCMVDDYGHRFNVIEYEARTNGYRLMEVENLEEYTDFPVNKILTAGDSAYLKEHAEEMAEPFRGKLSMMFTANFYFEYMAVGVEKGKSCRAAMDQLGIKAEECIAFGDAENDISMLKYAGIGVAMGNASEEVKAVADTVTEDNDHDGIASCLARYIPELHTFD